MENKFKQFLSQFNNKSVEVVDASSKYQCFDLVVAWCDWLGIPRVLPHLYAYQIYTVWQGEKLNYFDRIVNTPDAVPKVGDIIVWGKTYNGTAGHTAVSTGEGGLNTFKAFAQNDPVGSPSVVRAYNYNNVLGWLRPRLQSFELDECLRAHKEAVDSANKKDEEIKDLKERIKNYQDADIKSKKQMEAQQDEIENLRKDKNTLEKKLELLKTEMDNELAKQELDCQAGKESLTTRLAKDFEIKEENYKKTISDLESKLKEKEVVVEKEEPRPKNFREWLLKILELWPK